MRGMGRAVLAVKVLPRAACRKILLKSCRQNLSWDRQMDGSRALYTLDLLEHREEAHDYRAAIARALNRLNYETNHHDVSHVMEMSTLLALRGDTHFR
ncbi:unnamed protein product, partial [Phaeothamnion confervicola]